MKKLFLLAAVILSLTAAAQDRTSLLQAAMRNSNASDSLFLLRDSALAHIYYDAESDSMLLAGLKSETYLTPADIEYMRAQLKNHKPHTWTADSIPGARIIASTAVPTAALNPKKSVKAWSKYFKTNKTGYYEVSAPVFSKDGKTAIVYVGFQCGASCGNGGATVYRYENGQWKPVKNLFSWEK